MEEERRMRRRRRWRKEQVKGRCRLWIELKLPAVGEMVHHGLSDAIRSQGRR